MTEEEIRIDARVLLDQVDYFRSLKREDVELVLPRLSEASDKLADLVGKYEGEGR